MEARLGSFWEGGKKEASKVEMMIIRGTIKMGKVLAGILVDQDGLNYYRWVPVSQRNSG